ncbi:hypothetical protein KCV87_04155 [Actinosynnema pretiosum subsp. pretiosum]|uniref:Uncharacterized protein n=1 Tax=Actinosynnema pretiosum subsp. pretiosum TaxID=103721 RepID=A0AA45L8Q0_9PSEU|nr:hypothetical protein KCV87_04155 [Actinosynnema pretiosum subsp. pretiosum]
MKEQQEVIARLRETGVLAAVRWACLSATERALSGYSEADGLDAAWLGNTRFTYFRDRLDRVFACERYAVPSGDDNAHLDLLHAELSYRDVRTMPHLPSDLVRRSNLNHSPGWALDEHRFLLASGPFGGLDRMPWPRKSPTKQRVARRHNPEPSQPSLFDDFADEEIGGLQSVLHVADEADLTTFVVAHSLDQVSGEFELVLGRPRLNSGGGRAWHWSQDLLSLPPSGGGRRVVGAPPPQGPNQVPDARVRLRHRGEERRGDRASGER